MKNNAYLCTMDKINDFRKLILEYSNLLGISVSQLSEISGVNNRSLSSYLNENVQEIGSEKIEKIFGVLGIDTSLYLKRLLFAKNIASKLKKQYIFRKDVDISKMPKHMLITNSGEKDIELYLEVKDPELFSRMIRSNMIDITSTYNWLQAAVSFFMAPQISNESLEKSKITAANGAGAFNFYVKKLQEQIKPDQNKSQEQNIENILKKIDTNIIDSVKFCTAATTKFGGSSLFNTITSSIPILAAAAAVLSITSLFSEDQTCKKDK